MLPKDILCRAAVYPSCFIGGQYDREAAVQLSLIDPDRRDYKLGHAMSLASRFLCVDENGVHQYGIQLECLGNLRKSAGNPQPLPVATASHYIGYFEIEYCQISEIVDELHSIRIYWMPENGLDEHFQFEMTYTGGIDISKADIKRAVRTTKQKILSFLSLPTPRPEDPQATKEEREFRNGLIEFMMAA